MFPQSSRGASPKAEDMHVDDDGLHKARGRCQHGIKRTASREKRTNRHEGFVEQEALRRRRELGPLDLKDSIEDEAEAADDEHGDERAVRVASDGQRREREWQKELRQDTRDQRELVARRKRFDTDQRPTKAQQDKTECVELLENVPRPLKQWGLGSFLLLGEALNETLNDRAVVQPDEDGDGGRHDDRENDLRRAIEVVSAKEPRELIVPDGRTANMPSEGC